MNFKLPQLLDPKTITSLILILALTLVGLFFYNSSQSGPRLLSQLWAEYKNQYIDQSSGRTIDEQANGVTTSEGQSYTMLRSVWSNDRETFDKSWKWTKDNLSRPNDNLFSWLWGEDQNGKYGILTNKNGQNVAIDGDIDIAYSLILASRKWGEDSYKEEAKKIIYDVWDKTVINSNSGRLILASNDLEKTFNKDKIVVNPSYFSTYAFHEFAKVTTELPWGRLSDDCYYFLNQIFNINSIEISKPILPFDWIEIDKTNLQINLSDNRKTYGYDATRIPWRVALDYELNRNIEALEYLKKLEFLSSEFNNKNLIYTVYDINGNVKENNESLLAYSTALAYFDKVDSSDSSKIVNDKIFPKLTNKLGYYESNWVWFGLALHYNIIP
jgi:endoglucanase